MMRISWYKRVRLHIFWGLLLPIVICGIPAVLLDKPFVLVVGVILGSAMALLWSFIWIVKRQDLEAQGFRW